MAIVAWINWTFTTVSQDILERDLATYVLSVLDQLPARRGWIAEILSVLYAIDATKLWLALRIEQWGRWPSILFSLDSAIVSFILARSFLSTLEFVRYAIARQNP